MITVVNSQNMNQLMRSQDVIRIFASHITLGKKGTVENINGLIRRFFPKGTNFDTITDEDIIKMENWINNLPMKVLGFKTPNEMALAA